MTGRCFAAGYAALHKAFALGTSLDVVLHGMSCRIFTWTITDSLPQSQNLGTVPYPYPSQCAHVSRRGKLQAGTQLLCLKDSAGVKCLQNAIYVSHAV